MTSNPLPPLFPVELSRGIKRSDLPKFDAIMKVLEETLPETALTQMVGGGSASKETKPRYIQPHNHRLFFDFNKASFRYQLEEVPGGSEIKGSGLLFPVEPPRPINHGAEIQIKFKEYEVRVKKTQIEILNLYEHKKLYQVDKGLSREAIQARVKEVKEIKRRQTLGFLRLFIGQYGGKSSGAVLKELVEIKHFDERLIPLTPLGSSWYHKEVKKVYPQEHVIEPLNYEASANTLINMALHDFAPEIARELEAIKARLEPPRVLEAPKLTMEAAQSFLEARKLDICLTCGWQRQSCKCLHSKGYKTQEEALSIILQRR